MLQGGPSQMAELAAFAPTRAATQAQVGHLERYAIRVDLSRTQPDTIGHRASWGWADKGLAALAESLRAEDASTASLVASWAERLRVK